MGQVYSANNLWKFERGSQVDIGIASGGEATDVEQFLSLTEFTFRDGTPTIPVTDNEGNLSTNQSVVLEDKMYQYTMSGSLEIDKLTRLLYYGAGKITSVQDGATGAYTNTITFLNNVIKPLFTVFYRGGALGWRRLKNCQVVSIEVTGAENDKVNFTVTIKATGEDSEPPTSSSVSSLVITDIEYQSGSYINGGSIMRYTFSGTPVLSTLSNGDILRVPSTITGVTNSENIGDFVIVSVDDASDTIDVINNKVFDNSLDETGLTTNSVTSAIVVTPFVYPEPSFILMNRQAIVKNAATTGAIAAANADGLQNFTFSFNNNSLELYEDATSEDPLTIMGGRIGIEASFTQTLNGINAIKKFQFDEDGCTIVNQAWYFEAEDDCSYLGTSTTLYPLMSLQVEGRAIGTVTPGAGDDKLSIDWTLTTQQQQQAVIVLQNEVDGSTF